MASNDTNNFCYYPFMQLLLQPTGVVSPCCWNQSIVAGQVPQQSFEEIWNSEKMQALRREFLEGRPVSCAQQIKHIGCHKHSHRDFSYELELKEVQSKGPRRLDVRLNGKCNLQCVMCDVWQQPNGVYEQSDFWTKGPSEIFPHLREVDVLGGEPFIQRDTFRLIDMVSEINPTCTWAFVTNGQYKLAEAIRSRLDKINIRWIQVSLDSVDPQNYERVRSGGTLERVMRTLGELINYRRDRINQGRGFALNISMCVHQLNWQEVGAFFNFCRIVNLRPCMQFAFEPEKVSLLSLGRAERQQILDNFLALGEQDRKDLEPVISPLRDSLAVEPQMNL